MAAPEESKVVSTTVGGAVGVIFMMITPEVSPWWQKALLYLAPFVGAAASAYVPSLANRAVWHGKRAISLRTLRAMTEQLRRLRASDETEQTVKDEIEAELTTVQQLKSRLIRSVPFDDVDVVLVKPRELRRAKPRGDKPSSGRRG